MTDSWGTPIPGFTEEGAVVSNPTSSSVPDHTHDSVNAAGIAQLQNIDLGQSNWLRGGATGYNEGVGFWLGFDIDAFKFFIGNSAGNNMLWDGTDLSITGSITATTGSIGGWAIGATTLSAGSVTLDSGNEQIRLGAAVSAVSGTGVFIGKDGSDYEIRAGDPNNQYFHWDGSELNVESRLTYRNDFTAGVALTQGEAVAIESDGNVYTSRISDFDALEDSLVETTPSNATGLATVRISRTVALTVYYDSALDYQYVVYDPEGQTITSATDGNFAGTSIVGTFSVARMTDTTALVIGLDGTDNIYGFVAHGLDSGVSKGADASLDTSAKINPKLVRVTDTTAIMFYIENPTNDIKARILTISGTTVSSGSEQSIYTGNAATVINEGANGCCRFGDSDNFIVPFTSVGADAYLIAVSLSGSTLTPGSAVDTGYGAKQADVCSLDDDRVAYGILDSSNVDVMVVSRSGTTLTVNSATTVDTSTNANGRVAMAELGADSCAISWTENAGGASGDFISTQLARISDTTVTALGTSVDTSNLATSDISNFLLTPNLIGTSQVGGSGGTGSRIIYNIRSFDNNYSSAIGLCAQTTAASSDGAMILTGYSDDNTGLTAATKYYIGVDGKLVTYEEGGLNEFGIALSTTEIKITI